MFPICIDCYNKKTKNDRLFIHKISRRKCSVCQEKGDFLYSVLDHKCEHPDGCDLVTVKFQCKLPEVCIFHRIEN